MAGMTSFTNEMSLGAANSPDLAYAYGKSIALECRSVGVKWVLHPVTDLNLNPFNPTKTMENIESYILLNLHDFCDYWLPESVPF